MTEWVSAGLSEESFWESEPKKVIAIIDQKNETEKIKMKNLAIYISCYIWGKEPEETNKKKEPIPGIDIPADESLLNFIF